LIKEPPNRVIGLGYALDEFLIDPGREGLQLSCAPKYLFAPCKLFLQKRRSFTNIQITRQRPQKKRPSQSPNWEQKLAHT